MFKIIVCRVPRIEERFPTNANFICKNNAPEAMSRESQEK